MINNMDTKFVQVVAIEDTDKGVKTMMEVHRLPDGRYIGIDIAWLEQLAPQPIFCPYDKSELHLED